MISEKIERVQGDLNFTSINLLNNLIESNKSESSDNKTITKSLSFILENQCQMNAQDLIPFYNELDQLIFDNLFSLSLIYSEMKEYHNIEQIQSQRILIQKNNSSSIVSVMDQDSQQLMVIKKIETYSLENAIQKLDEYKIHYNINKKQPYTTLKLFTPVQIYKQDQNYKINACLERAQFNLYEYSRKYQITKEHAQEILFQIVEQIINLHSINIAHRDVKPQNISYVKDKGWLLSDFGESQYYQEVYSSYNIRGTMYFLSPQIKSQIHNNKQINQNLLANDIYALVVSIIMIQQQEYIPNIQEEIEGQKDQVFKDLQKITSLEDLISFIKQYNLVQGKKFYINQDPIYKQLNNQEYQENSDLLFKSWISIYSYNNEKKLSPQLMQQLLQIIQLQTQSKQIFSFDSVTISNLYYLLFDGINIQLDQPNKLIRQFDQFNIKQQDAITQLLFQFGFNEKTIYYARKILNHTYSQQVHLLLILSYERAFMYDESNKERLLFNQYLQFDQLDTSSQYYLFLDYNSKQLSEDSNEYLQKSMDQNLIIRKNKLPCLNTFKNKHYNQININMNTTVDVAINYLQQYCAAGVYSSYKEKLYLQITKHMYSMMPIEIYKFYIQQITVKYIESIDNNRKVALYCDLGEIFVLHNQSELQRVNLKKIKQMIFNPDSLQQEICFKVQIQFLKIGYQKNLKKIQYDKQINSFKQLIQNCSQVKIYKYQVQIVQNLLSLIHRLYIQKIQYNANIIYIIQFSVHYAYNYNYHLKYLKEFINYHKKAQNILYQLRNQKRIMSLIKNYETVLNKDAREYIFKIQMVKLRENLKQDIKNQFKESNRKIQKKFIFEQYLNRY